MMIEPPYTAESIRVLPGVEFMPPDQRQYIAWLLNNLVSPQPVVSVARRNQDTISGLSEMLLAQHRQHGTPPAGVRWLFQMAGVRGWGDGWSIVEIAYVDGTAGYWIAWRPSAPPRAWIAPVGVDADLRINYLVIDEGEDGFDEAVAGDWSGVYSMNAVRAAPSHTKPSVPIVLVPDTTWGPHIGHVTQRANWQWIKDNYAEITADLVDNYGAHQAIIPLTQPIPQKLIEKIRRLRDYPLFDDDTHGNVESEMQNEAWDDAARREFRREVLTPFFGDGLPQTCKDKIEESVDDVPDNLIDNLVFGGIVQWGTDSSGRAVSATTWEWHFEDMLDTLRTYEDELSELWGGEIRDIVYRGCDDIE